VLSGELRTGALAQALVDVERRKAISRSHTATHMVHKAIREALGETATQAGSENAPGRFRFDFHAGSALPMSVLRDVEARVNALLAGQVDLIETPAPDAVPQLRARGMVITQNIQPHFWPWQPCFAEGSPLRDVRVRRALNMAVDVETMLKTVMAGRGVRAAGEQARFERVERRVGAERPDVPGRPGGRPRFGCFRRRTRRGAIR
jgi:hypothetical protein